PDDAEIAAFGLYAGRNATIVTVTSGNAGDANYQADFPDAAQQYLFKGFLRAVDSVTVPWQGGIPPERCFNLGYFDARLGDMHERKEAPVTEMYGPNGRVQERKGARSTEMSAHNEAALPCRGPNVAGLLPVTAHAATWPNLV